MPLSKRLIPISNWLDFLTQAMKVGFIPIISASLLRGQTGGNCDFDIGDDWNRFKADNGESVLSFDLPSW